MKPEDISQLFPQEVMHFSLAVEDGEAAIARMAQRLGQLGYVRDGYLQAVLTREANMPTGLPTENNFAVAVPHADPVHVERPVISFANLAAPVAFQNMEEPDQFLPVRVIFMLALDGQEHQIGALQLVAKLLQNPAMLEDLANVQTPEQVIALLEQAAQMEA